MAAAERALLEGTQQAGAAPPKTQRARVEELRTLGYAEQAILDAALTLAYCSFVNHVVLLLGVPLEGDYALTCAPEVDPEGF